MILRGSRSIPDGLKEAFVVPFAGIFLAAVITLPVALFALMLFAYGVSETRRRNPARIAAYLLVAAYWVFLAKAMSDLDL